MGRNRIGKEAREKFSIRLEPKIRDKIVKKYKQLQAYIDLKLSEDGFLIYNKPVKPPVKRSSNK